MRRIILLLAVVALMMAVVASPAWAAVGTERALRPAACHEGPQQERSPVLSGIFIDRETSSCNLSAPPDSDFEF